MVVREASFDLPFGVVTIEGSSIVQIAEKPQRTYLVNAGIYVIAPDLLRSIPADDYLDMPALFTTAITDGRKTAAFPLHEYWIDIGRLEELERAQAEWNQ
jgi:NDP-sugar pyrophosphorylase family protein